MSSPSRLSSTACLRIRGASQNNLKNLDLDIPLGQLVVVTGVSGSGKSTLAFDTIYAEGQRRYVESFSAYARQFLDRMAKAAVVSVRGIPPAIAIDQADPVRTSRSTVGTMTDIADHLKLLFARAGVMHCRGCGRPVRRDSPAQAARKVAATAGEGARLLVTFRRQAAGKLPFDQVKSALLGLGFSRVVLRNGAPGELAELSAPPYEDGSVEIVAERLAWSPERLSRLQEALEQAYHYGDDAAAVRVEGLETLAFSGRLHCADCDLSYREPAPNHFSFNSPLGACETCKGFGRTIDLDFGLVIPDPSLTLRQGAIKPWTTESTEDERRELHDHCRRHRISLDVPFGQLPEPARKSVLEGDAVFYGVRGWFGWLETKTYKMHVRVFLSRYRSYTTCLACGGSRLKPDALLTRVMGQSIAELNTTSVGRLHGFFEKLLAEQRGNPAVALIAGEVESRLRYLVEVGLEYLTLDRQSRTLSGGEVQRVNLTAALGSSLVNTLYVLDEPSIGLHARDNRRLLGILRQLRSLRNTLLVVEHDPDIIRGADRVIDLGPGAGAAGGEILFQGPPEALAAASDRSLTARYLSGKVAIPQPAERRRPVPGRELLVRGARAHNLAGFDVRIPLGCLVALTGVSGSGKSTLMLDVLHRALERALGRTGGSEPVCDGVDGAGFLDDVVLVDQSPVGRTSRAIPATYVGAYDLLRKRLAATPQALESGLTAAAFSFNVPGGRCEACRGEGFEKVEMQFLPDVFVPCDVCGGKRFGEQVRSVLLRGKSVEALLEMTADEAVAFFAGDREVLASLEPLTRVGLGYMRLGQPVNTLSGGEAQRLKLAAHLRLGTRRGKGVLFLLDEPTTGLHLDDVRVLVEVLRGLVERGDSVLVIEHHMDVIRCSDWVIDLGPEGGDGGGRLVAVGTPEEVARCEASHTGRILRETMGREGWGHEKSGDVEHPVGSSAPEPSPGEKFSPGPPEDWRESCPRSQVGVLESVDQASPALLIAGSRGRLGSWQGTGDSVPGDRPGSGAELPRGGPVPLHPLTSQSSPLEPRVPDPPIPASFAGERVVLRGARMHNLDGLDLDLPLGKQLVLSGVSGSGKSTLAFDILYAEGRRRYLDALSTYARQYLRQTPRPDVDLLVGVPPTIALEQRTTRAGSRSTVATTTEIYHFLRLLYARSGVRHCPGCGDVIGSLTPLDLAERILENHAGQRLTLLAPMVQARKGFHKEVFKAAERAGIAECRADGERVDPSRPPALSRFHEHTIEAVLGEVDLRQGSGVRGQEAGARGRGSGVRKRAAKVEAPTRRSGLEPRASSPKPTTHSLQSLLQLGLQLGHGTLLAEAGGKARVYSTHLFCARCGRGFPELDPRQFSFNSSHGACPACNGYGATLVPSDELVVPDPARSLRDGALALFEEGPLRRHERTRYLHQLEAQFGVRLDVPFGKLPQRDRDLIMHGGKRGGHTLEGLLDRLYRYSQSQEESEDELRVLSYGFLRERRCEDCQGQRLKPESLAVRLDGMSIAEFTALPVDGARQRLAKLEARGRDRAIALSIIGELSARLGFLERVGVGYLTLDRPAETLSGGEMQRVRLAAQLGSSLTGVLYILDEPTIGLHPRDTGRLLDTLSGLAEEGNTVLVVEHDEQTIRWADEVIDLGPGAGRNGGRLVARGTPDELAAAEGSPTGACLRDGPLAGIPLPRRPTGPAACPWLELQGARAHNLRNLDVRFPLGRFVCVTGVSGSGKSSLVRDVLYHELHRLQSGAGRAPEACDAILGHEPLERIVEVDQSPIGRTPRSVPATYVGAYDHIRRIFAATAEARARGYGPGRFSFNVQEGRCRACEGAGEITVQMNFLPDVHVECEECEGRRFDRETLAVLHQGKSIAEVLAMTVAEACEHFQNHPPVKRLLDVVNASGLGYLALGQPSNTLSGGEAQRIKLAEELGKRSAGRSLYVLDEPTTGLHASDVRNLLLMLHSLVDRGDSLVVIEHNPSVICSADHVIDLGPEGGSEGGRIVAAGTPEEVARRSKRSHTGAFLKEILRGRL